VVLPNVAGPHPGAPVQLASNIVSSATSKVTSTRYRFFMNCLRLKIAVAAAPTAHQEMIRNSGYRRIPRLATN
jgi:hypothetical protein